MKRRIYHFVTGNGEAGTSPGDTKDREMNSGKSQFIISTCISLCILTALMLPACTDDLGTPDRTRVFSPAGHKGPAWIKTELYFGLRKPLGRVTGQEWEEFITEFVSPRLSEGLTVIDGYGQWLHPQKALAKEECKIVVFIHRADGQHEDAIKEVRSEYKRRFRQQSVLRVDTRANASW